MHLAVSEALTLSPGDVFRNAATFFLGKARHDGDKKLALAVKCENTFLFEVTFHAVFLQLADGDQTVHGVPGKSADRLCDNEVDFSGKSIRNHAVKAVSLFGVTAGNALIRIYFYEIPFRLGLYEFGVIIHLGFVAGELLIAVGGNTGISCNTPLLRCHLRQVCQRIDGCGYHGYFRHCACSSLRIFGVQLPSSRPSSFHCGSGLSMCVSLPSRL